MMTCTYRLEFHAISRCFTTIVLYSGEIVSIRQGYQARRMQVRCQEHGLGEGMESLDKPFHWRDGSWRENASRHTGTKEHCLWKT
jgi:hypothetical protein